MKTITGIGPKLWSVPWPIVQVCSLEKCFTSRQEQVSEFPKLYMEVDLVRTNHQMRSIKIKPMILFVNNDFLIVKLEKECLIFLLLHLFIINSILIEYCLLALLLVLLLLQHLQHQLEIIGGYLDVFLIVIY